MADWFWGAAVAVAVGLIGSWLSHLLATHARRKELAESRMQDRREAVYFEVMDYFDRRLTSLQKRTTEPWLPAPDVEGGGVLGRLEIVAGKEVIGLTGAYLNELTLALTSLSSDTNKLYLLKVRLDELLESVARIRTSRDEWLSTARELSLLQDDRAGKAKEAVRAAQQSMEQRQNEVRTHFNVYQQVYLSIVEKLHGRAPELAACQARLAAAIRDELGMPNVPFLIDDAKRNAQEFYWRVKSHIDEQRRELNDLLANDTESGLAE